TNKATGESKKHNVLMKYVAATNSRQLTIVNVNAFWGDTLPAGMSRMAVRGFLASMSLSRNLLKAMAALRAVTIHTNIRISFFQSNVCDVVCKAKKNPINANGRAKTLCANSTKDMYFFILLFYRGGLKLLVYSVYDRQDFCRSKLGFGRRQKMCGHFLEPL